MNMVNKTLILITSVMLCASCTNHSKHDPSQAGMDGQHAKRHAARTRGVDLAQDVNESDNGMSSSDNDQSKSLSAYAKCVPTKPIGGTEQHLYFEFDKSNYASADSNLLKTQAQYLLSHPNVKVRIEGNADDRGSREYNVALAARRSKAIIEALKEQGVPENQCTSVSFGAEKPGAPGETEESYRCNRRVDIVYEEGR